MLEPGCFLRERNGYKEGKKEREKEQTRKTRERGGDVGKASFSGQKKICLEWFVGGAKVSEKS